MLFKGSSSPTPTVGLIFFALFFLVTALTADANLTPWELVLICAVPIIGCYVYIQRTFFTAYIVTNKVVAVADDNEELSNAQSMLLKDIGYIGTNKSFFARVFSIFRIDDYQDVFFSQDIASPPQVVFHNVPKHRELIKKVSLAVKNAKNDAITSQQPPYE